MSCPNGPRTSSQRGKPPCLNGVPGSPPDDPDKPNLSYLPGFTATISQIDGAAAAAAAARKGPSCYDPRPALPQEYLETVTHTETVVNNPPREILPSSPSPISAEQADQETAQLSVTAPLAVGAARGSQVVSCTISPAPKGHLGAKAVPHEKPFHGAAKIYDPLYYPFKSDMGAFPRDTVSNADEDY